MNQRKLERNARKARAAATQPPRQQGAQRDAQGRVHLALHRDPRSGETYLTLASPVFKEEWQNDLAAGTANTAVSLLGGEPSLEATLELAKSAMAAASRLSDVLLARAPEGAVACKAGCDHCCHQSVGVTVPEALVIFDHLKRSRSSPELQRIAAHISERHRETLGLSSSERYSPDHPCPFLEAGRCSIYEVRPLACRGMNSLDADDCAKRLRDSAARAAFLASGRGGYSFMEPIRAFHAISAGLQLSLAELYQLDMRPLELTAAMQLLLTGPESSAAEWLSGQTPFASAIRSDTEADPGLREASGALEPP
jgi:Fe-S-cluster containining protein